MHNLMFHVVNMVNFSTKLSRYNGIDQWERKTGELCL